MAREANVAVIFRRGPSKWTQVIKWNTQYDTFEYGHWFKGRIYEKRCDLSPDGTKLIYFVSKFNYKTLHDPEYTYAWTGVSKLPWLTALALWPKGNCWHGGGMFESNTAIFLNHRPERAIAHQCHQPPEGITIHPNPEASGEDEPLYSLRLARYGWNLRQEWKVRFQYAGGFVTEKPEIRERRHPRKSYLTLVMKRRVSGYRYWEEYSLESSDSGFLLTLPEIEWANWDQQGRLAVLSKGKLLILRMNNYEIGDMKPFELMDFTDQCPQEIPSPDWSHSW